MASKTGTAGPGPTRTTPTPGWSATRRRSRRRSGWAPTSREPDRQRRRAASSTARACPVQIWQQFMNTVLDGTPEEDLPDEPLIEGDTGEGVPEPEPEPEPTETEAPHRRAPRRRRTTPTTQTADGDPGRRGADDHDPDADGTASRTTRSRRHRRGRHHRTTTTPIPNGGADEAAGTTRRPGGPRRRRRQRQRLTPIPHTERVSSTPTGPSAPADGPVVVRVRPAPRRTGSSRPGPTRSPRRPARPSAARGAGTRSPAGRCSGRRCGSACCSPPSVLALAWIKQAPCSAGDWSGLRSSTRTSATPTPSRCSRLHGLDTGAVPYLDSVVEYPVLTGAFMALAAALAPGLRRRWPRPWASLPDVAAGAELLRGHLPAAVGVRAAGRPRGAGAVRPPPLGRRDDRALPAAVRARVHQLGPVRGRAGHPRHVGVGAPPAGARRGPARAGRRGEALSRCCCSARCSCCACGPGGCGAWLRTAVAARRSPGSAVEPAGRRCSRRRTGPGSSGSAGSRPADPDSVWNIAAARSPTSGCSTARSPPGETPAVLNAVVAVALLALLAAGVAWLTLAAPVRPRVGAAGVPAGRRLPAAQQGVEPAVLAVAAAAGGAGPAAVALAAAVAGHRGAGVGRRDALVPRHGQPRHRGRVVLPRGARCATSPSSC